MSLKCEVNIKLKDMQILEKGGILLKCNQIHF